MYCGDLKSAHLSIDLVRSKTRHLTRHLKGVEWRTVLFAVTVYAGWLLITYLHNHIYLPLAVIAGASLIAAQSSLQHETIHCHPTRSRRVNKLIGYPPLSLWLPYEIFQKSHLRHHINEKLTDPIDDPESKYVLESLWISAPPFARMIMRCNSTLLGRMLIGPFKSIGLFWWQEFSALMNGDFTHLQHWINHSMAAAVVIAWLMLCNFNPIQYFALMVIPGTSILLLRSYAEHRIAWQPSHRTAVVEDASILGLIFMNNNLHAVHHQYPNVSWYDLPQVYSESRDLFIRNNGGLVYKGYGEIADRYLLKTKDYVVHPFASQPVPNFAGNRISDFFHRFDDKSPQFLVNRYRSTLKGSQSKVVKPISVYFQPETETPLHTGVSPCLPADNNAIRLLLVELSKSF